MLLFLDFHLSISNGVSPKAEMVARQVGVRVGRPRGSQLSPDVV